MTPQLRNYASHDVECYESDPLAPARGIGNGVAITLATIAVIVIGWACWQWRAF